MLTGNSLARQGMLQKAVADAAEIDYKNKYLKGILGQQQNELSSLDRFRTTQAGLEKRKLQIEAERAQAMNAQDYATVRRLDLENTKLSNQLAVLDTVMSSGIGDPRDINLATGHYLGLNPINPEDNAIERAKIEAMGRGDKGFKPDVYMDENNNLHYVTPGQEIPAGWKRPTNEVQQQLIDLRVADAIARIEENPNSFTVAGDIATANTWSTDPVYYIQAEDPDLFDLFPGSKLNAKLIKVPLPPGMTAAGITQTAAANRISPIQVLIDAGVDFSKYGLTVK